MSADGCVRLRKSLRHGKAVTVRLVAARLRSGGAEWQSRRCTVGHAGACPGGVGFVKAVLERFGSVRTGVARQGWAVTDWTVSVWRCQVRRSMERRGSHGADRLVAARKGLSLFGSRGMDWPVSAVRGRYRQRMAVSDGQRIVMDGSGNVRLGAARLGSRGIEGMV